MKKTDIDRLFTFPTWPTDGGFPIVLLIHGGGWTTQDRHSARGIADFPIDWNGKNILGNALANGKITIPPEDIAIIEVQKTTGKNFMEGLIKAKCDWRGGLYTET